MDIKIPGYSVKEEIGKGAMAVVYLAIQESLTRSVALKILKDPETPEFYDRFLNEGKLIASMNHSNVITIYDIGKAGKDCFISMEYLKGGSLKEKIQQGLDVEQGLEVIACIAECLQFVHRKGIIHRDVKPSNIMFREDKTPVLTDFGIAKHLQQDSDLTATGVFVGSPNYISPEQAKALKGIDGRSDFYSLGIILHEVLTGKRPFQGDSYAGLIYAHVNRPPPKLPPEYKAFQALVNRMLAKNPNDRINNGFKIAETIRKLRDSEKENLQIVKQRSAKEEKAPAIDIPGTLNVKIDKILPPKKKLKWILAMMLVVVIGTGGLFLKLSAKKNYTPETIPIPIINYNVPDTTVPLTDRQKKLIVLFRKADKSLQDFRLMTPENDCTRYYLDEILRLDPDNEEALKGYHKIASQYAILAERELDHSEYEKAKRLIQLGLSNDPYHARLLELEKKANSGFFTRLIHRIFH